RCDEDGQQWRYSACPVGEACVDGGCVANPGAVLLVANSPVAFVANRAAASAPDALLAELDRDVCADGRDDDVCCVELRAAVDEGSAVVSSFALRYWIRRLAGDLAEAHGVRLALLGVPQVQGTLTDALM